MLSQSKESHPLDVTHRSSTRGTYGLSNSHCYYLMHRHIVGYQDRGPYTKLVEIKSRKMYKKLMSQWASNLGRL